MALKTHDQRRGRSKPEQHRGSTTRHNMGKPRHCVGGRWSAVEPPKPAMNITATPQNGVVIADQRPGRSTHCHHNSNCPNKAQPLQRMAHLQHNHESVEDAQSKRSELLNSGGAAQIAELLACNTTVTNMATPSTNGTNQRQGRSDTVNQTLAALVHHNHVQVQSWLMPPTRARFQACWLHPLPGHCSK